MLYLAPKKTFICHFFPGVHFRTIPEELLESASSIQSKFFLYFLGITLNGTFWHHLHHLSINIDEADNFDNRWKRFFDLKILLYLCLVWRVRGYSHVFFETRIYSYCKWIWKMATTFLIVSPPSSILMSSSFIDSGTFWTNTRWWEVHLQKKSWNFWQ